MNESSWKLSDKVCQWLVTGLWFSQSTPVSSINKTDRHDIIDILLKVVLNTKNLTKFYDNENGNPCGNNIM
jgi:hypothetical protein